VYRLFARDVERQSDC